MKRNFVMAATIASICAASSSSTDVTKQPQSIVVTAPGGAHEVVMLVGTSVKLRAVASDAAGDEIAGAGPFSFTSRNASIVTVDTAGVISGVGFGPTYVVVKLPKGARTLIDSIAVDVGMLVGSEGPPTSE